MVKIDRLVENYFSPPRKISFDMLYETVTNILEQKQTGTAFEDVLNQPKGIDEMAGAASERQETAFVGAIQRYASPDTPIKVKFANGIEIGGVTDAAKVTGLNEFGDESYTDVKIYRSKEESLNLSMKDPSSPSLFSGGGRGITSMAPDWLAQVTPEIVERLQEMGFEDGDVYIEGSRNIQSIMNKIARVYTKRYPKLPVEFVGYPDGSIYTLQPGVVSQKDKQIVAHTGDLIPYLSNPVVEVQDDKVLIINKVKGNAVAAQAQAAGTSVPDMFFKIGANAVRLLFAGTTAMGGPVHYVYKGPMGVKVEWNEKEESLSFVDTQLYDIDEFVKAHPDVYLRVRKRRADQPFRPNLKHPNGGYDAIFGTGIFSRESYARIVVAPKASSKGIDLGEIDIGNNNSEV